MASTAGPVMHSGQDCPSQRSSWSYLILMQSMYPVMDLAYKELQTKLTRLGIPVTKEVSASYIVLAGTKSLVEGAGLPLDPHITCMDG